MTLQKYLEPMIVIQLSVRKEESMAHRFAIPVWAESDAYDLAPED